MEVASEGRVPPQGMSHSHTNSGPVLNEWAVGKWPVAVAAAALLRNTMQGHDQRLIGWLGLSPRMQQPSPRGRLRAPLCWGCTMECTRQRSRAPWNLHHPRDMPLPCQPSACRQQHVPARLLGMLPQTSCRLRVPVAVSMSGRRKCAICGEMFGTRTAGRSFHPDPHRVSLPGRL